jgi:hypothetical protein
MQSGMMVFMNETPPDPPELSEVNESMRADARARVAANVRAEIARLSYPIGAVCALLGLHRNTVNDRLAGRSAFHAYEIVLLGAQLGVPVTTLLDVGDTAEAVARRRVGPGIIGPTS